MWEAIIRYISRMSTQIGVIELCIKSGLVLTPLFGLQKRQARTGCSQWKLHGQLLCRPYSDCKTFIPVEWYMAVGDTIEFLPEPPLRFS